MKEDTEKYDTKFYPGGYVSNKKVDTDKMEWEKRFDRSFMQLRDDKDPWMSTDVTGVQVKEFISYELQKAADSARVEVVEEIRRAFVKVFYASGESWFPYPTKYSNETEEEMMKPVNRAWEDVLDSLTDTNTKEE